MNNSIIILLCFCCLAFANAFRGDDHRHLRQAMNNMNMMRRRRGRKMNMMTIDVRSALDPFLLRDGDEFIFDNSYQSCALAKTIEREPSSVPKVVQYYALFCLYCATFGKSSPLTDTDGEVLIYGEIHRGIPGWIDETGWNDVTVDPCDGWFGIECNRNKKLVTSIRLINNRLTGFFPPEIQLLAGGHESKAGNLRVLDISDNRLIWDNFDNSWIPNMGNSLKILRYSSTGFSSFFPTLPSGLIEYDNSFAMISGPLEVSQFPNSLQMLILDGNMYESEIPELNHLKDLVEFSASNAMLRGTLPATWSTTLRELVLFGNELTGEIPTEYGLLSKLEIFRVEENQLEGAMPDEVCFYTGLPFGNLTTLGADCPDEIECTCCSCCGLTECGL